jgi:RecA/RadA recombinase
MSFLSELAKVSKNEYASIVSDGTTGDCTQYLDSGVYLLNALVSGSIYGGFPGNRITAIAGESSTGKTYFALSVVKTFLEKYEDGGCIYFESESALRKDDFTNRNIDASRVVMLPVTTVQDFKTQAVRILDKYIETPKEERKPLMFVLDSLGMLSTSKEVADASEGKDVRDMTRSQLIRGAFRVITLKLGQANVPLLVTNHTYDVIGYVPTKEMGGGSGLKYSASSIIFLSKKKLKENKEQTGVLITAEMAKSRLSKEGAKVEIHLDFENGLDTYHGLVDFACAAGVWEKSGSRIKVGEKSYYASEIYKNPDQYFTEDVMSRLNKFSQKVFKYGSNQDIELDELTED